MPNRTAKFFSRVPARPCGLPGLRKKGLDIFGNFLYNACQELSAARRSGRLLGFLGAGPMETEGSALQFVEA